MAHPVRLVAVLVLVALPLAVTARLAAAQGPQSAEVAALPATEIDGPPAPMPPATITRDASGRATVRAIRLDAPLRLDGVLDEPIYARVEPFGDFIQQAPDEGAPASEPTDTWIFFDDESIYVGARVYESVPESEWIANEMQRDSFQLINNDGFIVVFDTFYDRRNGFAFRVNPIGGFSDRQITDEGNPNPDWNPVWDVRTGRFDGGWTVELEVPFKSLRFPRGRAQLWGIQVGRDIRAHYEEAYLTPVPISAGPGQFRVSAAGTLVGLEVPDGNRTFEIKPYAIGSLASDRTVVPAISNDGDGSGGMDVKYGLTENLTADFTLNTDFAQVEVDEQQINLTRFSLFFPEKREFFLESLARRAHRDPHPHHLCHGLQPARGLGRAAGPGARRREPRPGADRADSGRRASHRQGGRLQRRRHQHSDGRLPGHRCRRNQLQRVPH